MDRLILQVAAAGIHIVDSVALQLSVGLVDVPEDVRERTDTQECARKFLAADAQPATGDIEDSVRRSVG